MNNLPMIEDFTKEISTELQEEYNKDLDNMYSMDNSEWLDYIVGREDVNGQYINPYPFNEYGYFE